VSSVREQALTALQTRLVAGLTGVAVQERNRPEPVRLVEGTKTATLYDGTCSAWSMEEGELGAWQADVDAVIEGWVGDDAHAELMAAVDALHLQVVTVLTAAFADKLAVAGVRTVDIGTCEFAVMAEEGTGPAMTFRQGVTLGLAVRAGDPSTGLT
jgi:hypothetical protein